jgi:hypothetical protein
MRQQFFTAAAVVRESFLLMDDARGSAILEQGDIPQWIAAHSYSAQG